MPSPDAPPGFMACGIAECRLGATSSRPADGPVDAHEELHLAGPRREPEDGATQSVDET
jgi:hypothetical protein